MTSLAFHFLCGFHRASVLPLIMVGYLDIDAMFVSSSVSYPATRPMIPYMLLIITDLLLP